MTKKSVLRKCSSCGTKIRLKARYCHSCGKPVERLRGNIPSSELIESPEGFETDKGLKTDKGPKSDKSPEVINEDIETDSKNFEEEDFQTNENITTKLDTDEIEAELAELKELAESESEGEVGFVDEEKRKESENDYLGEEIGKYKTTEIKPVEGKFFIAEEAEKNFIEKETEIAFGNVSEKEDSKELFARESKIADIEETEKTFAKERPADSPIEKPSIPFGRNLIHYGGIEEDVEKADASLDEVLISDSLTVSGLMNSEMSVEAKYQQEMLSKTKISRRFKHRKKHSQVQIVWTAPESEGNFLYLVSTIIFSLISLVLLLLMVWLK